MQKHGQSSCTRAIPHSFFFHESALTQPFLWGGTSVIITPEPEGCQHRSGILIFNSKEVFPGKQLNEELRKGLLLAKSSEHRALGYNLALHSPPLETHNGAFSTSLCKEKQTMSLEGREESLHHLRTDRDHPGCMIQQWMAMTPHTGKENCLAQRYSLFAGTNHNKIVII